MTATVQQLITEVSKTLQDEWNFVWDDQTELLAWLNQATSEIVWRDPMALTYNLSMATVAGVKQSLSPDATSLVDVRRNMGADGNTPGGIITLVPRDDLDASRPSWPFDPPAPPKHYVFDVRNPKIFYLWPQPPAPWYVEMIYNSVPDDVGLNDNFPLPAMFVPAAEYYMIYRALMRRGPENNAQGAKLAADYMALFDKALGASAASVATSAPTDKVNATG